MKNKRITIADIARETGYSKTAVSFAFNCPDRISKEAVDKILETAKDLDYIPDPMARNFSLGRHLTLGFLVPQNFDLCLSNPHVVEVLRGIGSVCEKHGYTFTLIPPLHSSIAESIKNATVDGIIGMGLEFDPEIRESLKKRKLPLVCLDAILEEDVVSISVDNVEAAKIQMETVLEYGHRDIALITLPCAAYVESTDTTPPGIAKSRSIGYSKARREYSINTPFPEFSSDATEEGGRKATAEILKSYKPSCIVTMSDIQAAGAIAELEERGIRVPEDISVVGFDGTIKNYNGKKLTTIDQSGFDKGTKCAELLFRIIEGENIEKTKYLLPFSLRLGTTLERV